MTRGIVVQNWVILCALCALLGLTACHPKPLDDALQGHLEADEGNRVITEYCQSCHIHRDFDPQRHVELAQSLYDRLPYTSAYECQVCHVARRDTWGERHRKTMWPAEVAKEPLPSSQQGS
jgi:hypothetical protein